MAELKKIVVSLPNSLVKEIDTLAKNENVKRDEFVKSAMRLYIKQKLISKRREDLAKGYEEMSKINLQIANEYFEIECETQKCYEDKLVECE